MAAMTWIESSWMLSATRRRSSSPADTKSAKSSRRSALPPPAPWSNLGWWVDVCAGGVDVLGPLCSFDENDRHDRDDEAQTFTGWATWSGTSFAAPKVTGRIAQLAMEEEISPRQAAELVIRDPDLPRIRGLGTYVS